MNSISKICRLFVAAQLLFTIHTHPGASRFGNLFRQGIVGRGLPKRPTDLQSFGRQNNVLGRLPQISASAPAESSISQSTVPVEQETSISNTQLLNEAEQDLRYQDYLERTSRAVEDAQPELGNRSSSRVIYEPFFEEQPSVSRVMETEAPEPIASQPSPPLRPLPPIPSRPLPEPTGSQTVVSQPQALQPVIVQPIVPRPSPYVSAPRSKEGGLPRFIPREVRTKIQQQTFREFEAAGVPKGGARIAPRTERYQEIGRQLIRDLQTDGMPFRFTQSPLTVRQLGAQRALQQTVGAQVETTNSGMVCSHMPRGLRPSNRRPIDQQLTARVQSGAVEPAFLVHYNPVQGVQDQPGVLVIQERNRDGLLDTLTIDLHVFDKQQLSPELQAVAKRLIAANEPVTIGLYREDDARPINQSVQSGRLLELNDTGLEQTAPGMLQRLGQILLDDQTIGLITQVQPEALQNSQPVEQQDVQPTTLRRFVPPIKNALKKNADIFKRLLRDIADVSQDVHDMLRAYNNQVRLYRSVNRQNEQLKAKIADTLRVMKAAIIRALESSN